MVVKIQSKRSGKETLIDPVFNNITIDMCVREVEGKYRVQYSRSYWLGGKEEIYETVESAECAIYNFANRYNYYENFVIGGRYASTR
jgi:hypothetical protein